MQIPFCGDSSLGRSSNVNASRSVNWYLEAAPSQDSMTVLSLVGTPGTTAFVTFPQGPLRGMHVVADRCFVVAGDGLYEVLPNGGSPVELAAISTSSSYVSMADNGIESNGVGGDQLIIVDGASGYIFNYVTSLLTTITDAYFPANPKYVAYLDGYFIVTNDTMGYHVSALYDGLTWPGLAIGAVTATPDAIQRPIVINQQLYFIKNFVTDVWYDAGVSTTIGSPFARVSGAVIDYGTPAPRSVARGGNALFFLANNRGGGYGAFAGVAMMTGYNAQIISSAAINYRISRFTTLDDALGYCYMDEGHLFYVLTFPTEDATFVYDVVTGMWHERSTHIPNQAYAEHRHLSDDYVFFGGKHLVSDYRTPALLEMSSQYYTDNGTDIINIRTAQPIYDRQDKGRVFISNLEVDMETGVPEALTTPIAWLSWSDDGGHAWSGEYSHSMGSTGEYKKRLKWTRLGAKRERIFKLRTVGATKKVILGAYVNGS